MRQREIESILRAVNRFRAATGQNQLTDIKPGLKSSASSCALARSINHNCSVAGTIYFKNPEHAEAAKKAFNRLKKDKYASPSHGHSVALPDLFSKFITQFDGGKLPKYVAKH